MGNICAIAKKEFAGFFSSLTAFIFFGAFLAVTLFVFFWADPFFARNIADVRPIFENMPLLLIFLVPALTMRMWSEERRSGTLELLITSPISNLELVLGKFAAGLLLVLVALALTLPIPLTVGIFAGDLDWGPVLAGYVAAIFLAAAYMAVGLYVSAKTDNQIVSFLTSCVVCGLFLMVGSDGFTSFFTANVAELLKLLGSGSRFQSVARGVIDLRDLYYYLSIAAVFICLNVLGLERLRWAGAGNARHGKWALVAFLCLANFVAANFWLQQITWARADFTDGHIYSISPATRKYLSKLEEPLTIRGYFSKRTHPLLAPLVPRLKDMLKEYAIAGNGKVHVEFVDPLENPALEQEANEKYGMKPVAFQTASRYQNTIANSYFDVLVKYGDQFEKLGFRDLIEVKAMGENDLRVDLKNPEYDITSAIKKVMYSYQAAGNPFSGVKGDIQFTGYISDDSKLPKQLVALRQTLQHSLDSLKKESSGKFTVSIVDPDADGGKVGKEIQSLYGFKPMIASLLDDKTFWFYMTMKSGDEVVAVSMPETMSADSLDRALKGAIKRFSKGFLKTIGLYTPAMSMMPFGGSHNGITDFNTLRNKLSTNYSVRSVKLTDGEVPGDVDLLVVVDPRKLDDKAVFAIDQFLMKGGTVMIAASPFAVSLEGELNANASPSGLEAWLKHNGIDLQSKMVMDQQNFPLPIPVLRRIGSFSVEETQLLPYAYFLDIRRDGMNQDVASGIDQVTMSWASPITIDDKENKQRHVVRLLQSSPKSWLGDGAHLTPNYSISQIGFPEGADKGRQLVGTLIEGRFESFFKDKKSPLSGVIEKSPDSARLFVFSSPTFLSDRIQNLASGAIGSEYAKPCELLLNCADWSLQDRELLSIRGRSHYARPLRPMRAPERVMLEYGNYLAAVMGLIVVWLLRKQAAARARKRYEAILAAVPAENAQEVAA